MQCELQIILLIKFPPLKQLFSKKVEYNSFHIMYFLNAVASMGHQTKLSGLLCQVLVNARGRVF